MVRRAVKGALARTRPRQHHHPGQAKNDGRHRPRTPLGPVKWSWQWDLRPLNSQWGERLDKVVGSPLMKMPTNPFPGGCGGEKTQASNCACSGLGRSTSERPRCHARLTHVRWKGFGSELYSTSRLASSTSARVAMFVVMHTQS